MAGSASTSAGCTFTQHIALSEGHRRSRGDCNHQYLAKELFSFAGLEVQSGKSHEQIAKLGGAVALTLCCVVLVENC